MEGDNFKGIQVIPVYEGIGEKEFQNVIESKREPAILRGVAIGSCTKKWNTEYLIEKLSSKNVRVHVGVDPNLDFRTKNFKYCDMDIKELVRRACNPRNSEHFINEAEYYYLRSVSGDARNISVSNLDEDFPEISSDFQPPLVFKEEQLFSSVLRISSAEVRIWTHYDVTDNIYCQIIGHKTAVLWPPHQASNLYLQGDKSAVLDIDSPGEQFPLFPSSDRWEGRLLPGDVLFIPALWFHNMKAEDFGVAVNVFWKELDKKFYDPKDFYGNKELLPGAKSLAMLDNVIKQLKLLPPVYRDFYARRAVDKIQQNCCFQN